MDVRHCVLGIARGADRPNAFAFDDAVVRADQDRAEMEKRDGVAVGCPDRHRAAVCRQQAGEGDPPASRRGHSRSRVAADIDPRMTALTVLRTAEVERP